MNGVSTIRVKKNAMVKVMTMWAKKKLIWNYNNNKI